MQSSCKSDTILMEFRCNSQDGVKVGDKAESGIGSWVGGVEEYRIKHLRDACQKKNYVDRETVPIPSYPHWDS